MKARPTWKFSRSAQLIDFSGEPCRNELHKRNQRVTLTNREKTGVASKENFSGLANRQKPDDPPIAKKNPDALAGAIGADLNEKAVNFRSRDYRTGGHSAIPVRIELTSGLTARLHQEGGLFQLYLWGRGDDWAEYRGRFDNPTDAINALVDLAREATGGK